jgi:hypothetical protein
MSDIDIDNFCSSSAFHEEATYQGYIHKDDILKKLAELERDIVSLSTNIMLLKEWVKE